MTTNPASTTLPTTPAHDAVPSVVDASGHSKSHSKSHSESHGESHSHTHSPQCFWDLHQARWSCEPPRRPEPPMVDVRDMLVVHTALLRELRLAPGVVGRVDDGDAARARVVGRHVRLLLDLLHHHHEGEDELLWPPLRDRVPPQALPLLDEVEEQHGDLDAEIAAVRGLLGPWETNAAAGHREPLALHLGHLHALLADHLDLEERAVLPLAAAVLTQREWDAVGAAGAAGVRRPDLPLVLGMFAYEGDPAVVRRMLESAPRVVRRALPPLARRAYARRARQVHGTARP